MTAAPAIRLINYMGDMDDYREANLIGPYPSVEARDADHDRIMRMHCGSVELHTGLDFTLDTMAEATPTSTVVSPERIATATTWQGVFNNFFGCDD